VRVLVTGAAGFIGSATADYLVELGHDVTALDNLCAGSRDNVPAGARFVEGSVGDGSLVRELGTFDACVHFAAFFAPGESMRAPERFFTNNAAQTLELLDALIATGVGRFVFSSSCAVYGDDVTVPIDEDHPTRPHSPYGESKLIVEQALAWLTRLGRIRTASLRYFNAAGAVGGRVERHEPEVHLIPIALQAASGARDGFDLFGDDYPTRDGTCVRDYVHLTDLAAAHALAIDALESHDALTVNLGAGVGYTNREVLGVVRDVTGRDFDVRVAARRPGDPAEAVASTTRAKRVLGWEPTHSSLPEIVGDAWDAYLAAAR
jgi:UDP-glucose 4-epimerase